jgi:hypothetical protein
MMFAIILLALDIAIAIGLITYVVYGYTIEKAQFDANSPDQVFMKAYRAAKKERECKTM